MEELALHKQRPTQVRSKQEGTPGASRGLELSRAAAFAEEVRAQLQARGVSPLHALPWISVFAQPQVLPPQR
eukprot:scaffold15590_cov136-Isochrysis_galbana.AAC.6